MRYGRFSGTIGPDLSLDMVYGKARVVGRFNGPHFAGRYIAPICSYDIAMDRTD